MPLILTVDPVDPDMALIHRAAEMLRSGLVIAYPTDTVYGLAVDPRNRDAVSRLFTLKGRPESSALTLIAAELSQAEAAGEMTADARRLAARWWPGPLTIVIPAGAALTVEALAGGRTVGVRVPDHAVARALAGAFGFCITATSANRSAGTAAINADGVAEALPLVDGIVDGGPCRGGAASTIVGASGTAVTLVRAGAVAWERVLESLQ